MTRVLLPILLILAAGGLFVLYTNPTYQSIKSLQAQYGEYNAALTQSSQVRAVRDQLLARRDTFSTNDVQKLERLLPDNVDNIRLIIDINDIAARYHLQVGNVSLSADQSGGTRAVGSASATLGSVGLSFGVSANYNDFLAFLQDLERSLRIIDVESIKFTSSQTAVTIGGSPVNNYTVAIKTYWLR